MVGQESKDGKWLFYARDDEKGIWRMPASGGPSVRILDQPAAGYWGYWAVGPNGIYFLDQKQSIPSISVYDFATGKTSIHARLNHPPPTYSGLSLLGRDILISDKYDAGSHITIAKGKF
jgi:outer membrane protein assembly factor BamB